MNITEIINQVLSNNYCDSNAEEIISSPQAAFRCIKEILKKHGKEESFISSFDFSNEHKNRMPHLLVTYSLGYYVIKNISELYPPKYTEEDLLQSWMVTSLFHDVMYFKKSKLHPDKVDINLKNFYTSSRMKPTYSRKELVKYFRMKFENFEYETIDHGIAGGVYLFNSLNFLFYKKTKTLQFDDKLNSYIDYVRFISYSKNDFLLIKDACKAICQHNLFKPNTSQEYERNIRYGLFEINNPDKKIGIDDFLTFVLSIVDTVDISKKIIKNFDLLFRYCENFDINFVNHQIVINIPDPHFYDELNLNREYYISALLDLKKWIKVDTTNLGNSIYISLF